ncbi:MAG TPA: PD-(D/E)XK nuclease family protein [Phototrophicaceae bacterium]|nr:PD-(D/E)XK nuclease family protein [Phototrophicaceae bacterium]
MRRSDVFAEIAHADEVYRELPFVYQTEQRTIHGVIDLLLRGADGQWRVVDYKTAALKVLPTPDALAEHARRYHLQMGIYAAAVQELVGAAPLAVIHYVRYAQTVIIAENRWQQALAQLEVYIGDVIKDG